MRIIMKVRFEIGWGIERECGYTTAIQDFWNVFFFFCTFANAKDKKWKREVRQNLCRINRNTLSNRTLR